MKVKHLWEDKIKNLMTTRLEWYNSNERKSVNIKTVRLATISMLKRVDNFRFLNLKLHNKLCKNDNGI